MDAATYTFPGVAKILDISESKLRYWAQVGFVGPSMRQGGKQLYTFQDLVSVKAAKELVERGFSTVEIRKALAAVTAALPGVDRPLDRIRVAFDGEALAVITDGGAFEVSGQKMFNFGLGELAKQVSDARPALSRAPGTGSSAGSKRKSESAPSSYDWFVEGMRHEAEPGGAEAAVACYRKALALDAGLAAAHTNLGNIAHAKGESASARASFEAALTLDPDQPEARFNLANLILEAGDLELAIAEFRRVLQIAPDFADAHYNLAVALERLGGRAQARAHLERYLGLESTTGPWAAQARTLIDRLAADAS